MDYDESIDLKENFTVQFDTILAVIIVLIDPPSNFSFDFIMNLFAPIERSIARGQ